MSHEISIRCPLIGTQSACSSLERAGHKLEDMTPGLGGRYTEDLGEGWELRVGRPCS